MAYQRLVLNSYSSVKNRTLAVSDSKVAEMNILKLMVVLGLATATSLLLFLKEKLRIRSYCRASDDSVVFVELKRKYDGVVYKRRMATDNAHAMKWCSGGEFISSDDQIEREIDYFIRFYQGLRPTVFLSYEREAYHGIYDEGFRLTFDENILARTNELSLTQPPYGEPLLNAAEVLMELKCAGGIPLFMVDILSSEKIYKTSFSKYGAAYRKLIFDSKCK